MYRKIDRTAANTQEMNMLAVFGIGLLELIILAVICMPVLIGLVVVVILATTKNRPRE